MKRLASFFMSYAEKKGIRLLLHCRGKYQTLGTLRRELSDSWYTEEEVSDSWYTEEGGIRLLIIEEGGIRHLVHYRGRYQTLGTLKREVSDNWYTKEGGIRLFVH